MLTIAVYFLVAFTISLLVTLAAEYVAPRAGLVAHPVADRWHRESVPLLGGLAIVAGTLVLLPVVVAHSDRRLLLLLLTSLAMAGVGLIDDARSLSPQVKLLAQILLTALLLQFGFVLRLTGYELVDVVITLMWVVGITNAFNLLDNMDGLSASLALIAAGYWLVFNFWDHDPVGILISAVFMGAVAGFLVRNFPPAKIFMGDAGSMFLGFFLAGLSVVNTQRAYSRGVAAVLIIPVLLLLVPLFDTAFVTLTRLLAGRSIAAGGRDHTSHRLVAIGLSERQTVLLLAALSAAAGGVAAISYDAGLSEMVILLALLVLGLLLLGIYLSRVHVVQSPNNSGGGAVLRLLADLQYKRQVLIVALDLCLILVSYCAAFVIRFEESLPRHVDRLYGSLPIVLLIQLVAFSAFGLYRGVWQYTGIADMLRIAKAVTAGTMTALVVIVYTWPTAGFSRSVFVLDWLLLVILLGASRASFRFFRELFRSRPVSHRRVLIYGAGDGGELILREILNNPRLERVPVGFIDDDRNKHQTRIHGLPVFGDSLALETIIQERRVTEVIVSSAKIQGNGLNAVRETCARLGVSLHRASFRLE